VKPKDLDDWALKGEEADAVVRILQSNFPWMSREEIIQTWDLLGEPTEEEVEEVLAAAQERGIELTKEMARELWEGLRFPDDQGNEHGRQE